MLCGYSRVVKNYLFMIVRRIVISKVLYSNYRYYPFFVIFITLFFPGAVFSQETLSDSLFKYYSCYGTNYNKSDSCRAELIYSISNQEEFNQLPTKIESILKSKAKKVEILIQPGVYFFSDKHINLSGFNDSDLCITIRGDRAKLVAGGEKYSLRKTLFSRKKNTQYEGSFPFNSTILTDDLNEISFHKGIQQTDSLLQIVSLEDKVCRIHTKEPKRFKSGKYIVVTTWFTSISGPIVKIEGQWIYFKSSSLEYNELFKCYNINLDYGYGKRYPRYVVYNDIERADAYIKRKKLWVNNNCNKVYLCNHSTFLCIENSSFKSLKLEGLDFVGSSAGNPLIELTETNCSNIEVSNSNFRSHKNIVIFINKTNNVSVSNCFFQDCSYSCVYSENGSVNTRVTNCSFYNNGRDYSQNHCVWCKGEKYYIANNVFRNFSYAAIRTGVLSYENKDAIVSGIIEYNEIYYDKEYYNSYVNKTLMDAGAIYVSTQNDNTIIRYNYIHDYIGLKDNRGIFCDTGTQNTRIYGNVIKNIPNSNAIEIWRVKSADKTVPNANDGNAVFLNVLDGKYRFDGKDNGRNNLLGKNFIFYSGNKPQIIQQNLNKIEPDVFIEYENELNLNAIYNNQLIKNSPIFPFILRIECSKQ